MRYGFSMVGVEMSKNSQRHISCFAAAFHQFQVPGLDLIPERKKNKHEKWKIAIAVRDTCMDVIDWMPLGAADEKKISIFHITVI